MRVAVLSEQGNLDINGEKALCDEDDSNNVRIVQDGEDKEGTRQAIDPSTLPSSPTSGGIHGKKRAVEYDASGEIGDGEDSNMRQRIRFNDAEHVVKAGEDEAQVKITEEHQECNIEVEKDEEDEEEEEEEEEDEKVFLSALKEFEAEDIDALKAYILAQEES